MSDKYTVGSTWRKWDLHVHTPASVVQNYGGNTEEVWEKFFKDLENLPSEFKVIGINDYIFVDGYEKVLAAKKSGRLQNIELILPVVELRLDKFCGTVKKDGGVYSKSDWNRINVHVIFDQLPPEVIRQQFINALAPSYDLIPESKGYQSKWQAVVTPQSLVELGEMVISAAPEAEKSKYASPLQEGFNNLCITLDKVKAALQNHQLKGRYVIAIGKAEWDNMKWNDQSVAEKRNVINSAEIVFSACENPAAYEKAKVKLTENGVLDRLLDCSDAHTFSDNTASKDRIGQCFTWIKADPTFAGLRQAITEFDQRVFVGDTPPKQLLVKSNRTKYISSVSIKKKPGSSLTDPWFDVEIPLNTDLVAIIGNKGSGKSALADAIALVGDTKNFADFSFLTPGRFRDPKTKLAAHFSGQLGWEDQTTSDKELHVNPSPTSVERVKYLPQSYLEKLCNELTGSGATTFDGELRKIIYTHVPQEQQLNFATLDELITFKISQLEGQSELTRPIGHV